MHLKKSYFWFHFNYKFFKQKKGCHDFLFHTRREVRDGILGYLTSVYYLSTQTLSIDARVQIRPHLEFYRSNDFSEYKEEFFDVQETW